MEIRIGGRHLEILAFFLSFFHEPILIEARLSSIDRLASSMTELYVDQYGAQCLTFIMEQGPHSSGQLATFAMPRILVHPTRSLQRPSSVSWFQCRHYLLEAENPEKMEQFVNETKNVLKQSGGFFTIILTRQTSEERIRHLLYSPFFSKVLRVLVWVPINMSPELLAFRHDVTTETEVTEVNAWSGSNFALSSSSMFTEILSNLKGKRLRAAAFGFVPFTARVLAEDGDHVYDGIEFRSFDEIAVAMNFTYRVHLPKTAAKWDGVVMDLQQGVTDFGVSHLFLTYSRASTLDYTPSVNTEYYCFLVGPPDNMPRWMSMIQPLSWGTWLALGITLACVFVFGYVYARVYDLAEMGPAHFVFFLVGAFIDNSHEETFWLKSNGIRVFMLNFLLASFVVTMAYKDSLISFMTVPTVLRPIDSIAEVVASPLPVRSLGGVVKAYLHTSEDPMMLELDAKYSLHNNLEQGFVNVTEKKVILLEAMQMAKYRLRRDFTDEKGVAQMHIVSECMQHFDIVFFMQKNSIYTESMARIVVRLKEAGVFDQHLEDGLNFGITARNRQEEEQKSDEPLTLFELQGVFVLVAILIAIALIALVIEIII